MRRRSAVLLLVIVVVLFATSGTVLAVLVGHVPAFFRQNEVTEGEARGARSTECMQLVLAIWNSYDNGQPWVQTFSQEQLNCYLQHESNHSSASLVELPDEVRDVRVALDTDRIRVGFRYGRGRWTTVISVDARVWLVAKEMNVVALELCRFRAGALPLGTHVLLDFISEAARQHNVGVTWYRHNGHPVALLRFQANLPRPTILLRQLEAHPGRFVLAGSPAHDPTQPDAPPAP
jgi:hypothetical protein